MHLKKCMHAIELVYKMYKKTEDGGKTQCEPANLEESSCKVLDLSSGDRPAWPLHLVGQPDHPVQVTLVEGGPHLLRVITNQLQTDSRIELLGHATSMRDAKRMVTQHDFDVMLLDVDLEDGRGYAMLEYVKQQRPLAEVVAISANEDEQNVLRAIEAGASGYLVKNSWFGCYCDAILQVVNGGAPFTPSVMRRLLRHLRGPGEFAGAAGRQGAGASVAKGNLTAREQEVLRMVANGYTSSQLAPRLGITEQTVNVHLKNIYNKLQVRTRAQAVSKALTLGLLY